MSEGQLQNADRARRDADARAAYLANQQAVAATPVDHRRWTPIRIVTLLVGAVALAFYIATVVSYYNSPQQDGPSNVVLPTIDSALVLTTAWLVLLPWLLESRSHGAKVRNVTITTIVAVALMPVGIPVFVELGSIVADLIYNVGHL